MAHPPLIISSSKVNVLTLNVKFMKSFSKRCKIRKAAVVICVAAWPNKIKMFTKYIFFICIFSVASIVKCIDAMDDDVLRQIEIRVSKMDAEMLRMKDEMAKKDETMAKMDEAMAKMEDEIEDRVTKLEQLARIGRVLFHQTIHTFFIFEEIT